MEKLNTDQTLNAVPSNIRTKPITAIYTVASNEYRHYYSVGPEEYEKWVKRKLIDELATKLIDEITINKIWGKDKEVTTYSVAIIAEDLNKLP